MNGATDLRAAVLDAMGQHPEGLTLDGIRQALPDRADRLSLWALIGTLRQSGELVPTGNGRPFRYRLAMPDACMARVPAFTPVLRPAQCIGPFGLACGARP